VERPGIDDDCRFSTERRGLFVANWRASTRSCRSGRCSRIPVRLTNTERQTDDATAVALGGRAQAGRVVTGTPWVEATVLAAQRPRRPNAVRARPAGLVEEGPPPRPWARRVVAGRPGPPPARPDRRGRPHRWGDGDRPALQAPHPVGEHRPRGPPKAPEAPREHPQRRRGRLIRGERTNRNLEHASTGQNTCSPPAHRVDDQRLPGRPQPGRRPRCCPRRPSTGRRIGHWYVRPTDVRRKDGSGRIMEPCSKRHHRSYCTHSNRRSAGQPASDGATRDAWRPAALAGAIRANRPRGAWRT
jgi:hypothetical protein